MIAYFLFLTIYGRQYDITVTFTKKISENSRLEWLEQAITVIFIKKEVHYDKLRIHAKFKIILHNAIWMTRRIVEKYMYMEKATESTHR